MRVSGLLSEPFYYEGRHFYFIGKLGRHLAP